jgi:hypothetical protein
VLNFTFFSFHLFNDAVNVIQEDVVHIIYHHKNIPGEVVCVLNPGNLLNFTTALAWFSIK